MASMKYFDYSRKKSNLFFDVEVSNGNACHNKIQFKLNFMLTVVYIGVRVAPLF
jgi:hypothetical protein